MGFNKQKLKTNLRLAINRLKLLEKKKTELAQKSRKEIADYLANGKEERARIRVEHIIREDYLVEAMELLELYSDLLLARFGLIESMAYCDDGMAEAVTSIIWSAPRLQTDVIELKVIAEQLGFKYGKKFAHDASTNENQTVNPRASPDEITFQVAQPSGFVDGHAQFCDDDLPNIDDMKSPRGGAGGGGGAIGFESYRGANPGLSHVPDIPAMVGPGRQDNMIHNPSYAYPPPGQGGPPGGYPLHPNNMYPPPENQAPPAPSKGYNGPPPYPGGPTVHSASGAPMSPSAPPPSAPSLPDIPDLPSVPTNSLHSNSVGGASAGGEDVDFDDLARRFEELKKKK